MSFWNAWEGRISDAEVLMSTMRDQLQDEVRREAFVEARLETMNLSGSDGQYNISLRAAVRAEYLKQIEDGLKSRKTWVDNDAATGIDAIERIEACLHGYAAGYEAGYKAALPQI